MKKWSEKDTTQITTTKSLLKKNCHKGLSCATLIKSQTGYQG